MPVLERSAVERLAAGRLAGLDRLDASVAALFLARAGILPREDQVLVELVFRAGSSLRRAGRLLGLSPGALSRRVRRILRKLGEPVAAALTEADCSLSAEYRVVAAACLVAGRPARAVARDLKLPEKEIRRRLVFIRGWLEGLTARRELAKAA